MAKWYARQQVGAADGSKVATDRNDARLVGARQHSIVASKNINEAWGAADTVYLGRVRLGESIRRITANCGAGYPAGATISIGPTTAPTKYANAVAVTTFDAPVAIGPPASIADDDPLAADEYLWATIAAAVGAALLVTIEIEVAGLN